MGAKLCPKIILEGTRLTFKTEIAFELNQNPRLVGQRKYRYHSPLISGEWCAFTNFPWGRGLINFSFEEEQKAMETYNTWIKLFELQKYYSWIIDRFHLSTKMYQKIYNNRDYDFDWLEQRLKAIGFRLVFLYRSTDSFSEAKAERLKVSGYPSQYDNLDIFINEQNYFHHLFEISALPKLALDISDNNIQSAVNKIADWMENTNALYADY